MAISKSHIRTCFITAPAGSNLDVLKEALRRRNVQVIVPHRVPRGAEFAGEISGVVANVDLVIGVLTRERRSEWVLFELGQLWAQGKRILLFAPPSSTHLPSTLRRLLTIRANLSNREAIEFALDQLLAAPEPPTGLTILQREAKSLGPAAQVFLQGSYSLTTSVGPAELEVLVADALREAGVDVVTASPDRDLGADLAVWSDSLQLSVGNPLLVEIKAVIPNAKATADAAQQLSEYVAASGGRWGLLLFGKGPDEVRSLPPNVLALSIEALFRRLQYEPFDDVVRDLRNRRVHGVGP